MTAPVCVLFVAHRLNDSVLDGWRHLKATLPDRGFDLRLLYDNGRHDFREASTLSREEACLFSFADLAARYPIGDYLPGRVEAGNVHYPIVAFHQARPAYEYVWKIEYDVVYDGAWAAFFSHFDRNDADLLTTTLGRPDIRPDWGWWGTLRKPWHSFGTLQPIRSFLPIARLSRRASQVLDKAVKQGWLGHDEVSVPSILLSKGLAIEDIGGDGEFVAFGNRNRFYSNTPRARGLGPGTFVCPPQEPTPQAETGKLYHPVKDRAAWAKALAAAR